MELTIDCWVDILSHCDLITIRIMLSTNRIINKADCNKLWTYLLLRDFEIIYNEYDAKEYYVYMRRLSYFRKIANRYSHLKYFDGSGKYIRVIDPDWYQNNCLLLSLAYNFITEIPEMWIVQHNIYIDNINLSGNYITYIPKIWNPQSRLLNLRRNFITYIPIDWNPQISTLDIKYNPIPIEQVELFRKTHPNIYVIF